LPGAHRLLALAVAAFGLTAGCSPHPSPTPPAILELPGPPTTAATVTTPLESDRDSADLINPVVAIADDPVRHTDRSHAVPQWQVAATRYLDERSASWLAGPPKVGNHFECAMSCHTTYPYMFVRPALGESPTLSEARTRLLQRVDGDGSWPEQTGFYGRRGGNTWTRSLATEAVLNASALALHDAAMEQPLSDATLRAMDRMWEVQQPNGAWPWLNFSLAPWESGNADWGAGQAAIAVGLAPEAYRQAHEDEIARLVGYLRSRHASTQKPMVLHAQLAMLWAARGLPELLSDEARGSVVNAVRAVQHTDGGWALRDLVGRSRRRVRKRDGYATGLATFVLCTETDTQDSVDAGLTWLRTHQRTDGAWPAWSLNEDAARNHLHMRDAAAAYAVLALTACSAPQR